MAIIIVSATRGEAQCVPDGLEVVVTGVGKVAAASAVAARLAVVPLAERPSTVVINIGTAGALRADLDGLHLPGTVINHDLSAKLLRELGLTAHDHLTIAGGSSTRLATGDSFIADPVARDVLAARADLVDMEGFSVAWACQEAGVRCVLVKHVSDNADGAAMSWRERVAVSARALGDWLTEYVSAIRVPTESAQ